MHAEYYKCDQPALVHFKVLFDKKKKKMVWKVLEIILTQTNVKAYPYGNKHQL